MPDEPVDDNKQDLSVYDLAERMALGQPMSTAAENAVTNELERLRSEITKLSDDLNYFLDSPEDEAREILHLRAELRRILSVSPSK